MQEHVSRKNNIDPSPEIQHLAKQAELGELRKVYPVLKSSTGIFGVGSLFILLAFLTFFFDGLAFYATIFPATPYPPAPSPAALLIQLIIALMALVLTILGLYFMLARRFYTDWHIYLWQHGFIHEKKQLRQVVRWSNIQSFEKGLQANSLFTLIIYDQNGNKISIKPLFRDVAELSNIVLTEAAKYLAPSILPVTPPTHVALLPNYKIDSQGISYRKLDSQSRKMKDEHLHWENCEQCLITEGKLIVVKNQPEQCPDSAI